MKDVIQNVATFINIYYIPLITRSKNKDEEENDAICF